MQFIISEKELEEIKSKAKWGCIENFCDMLLHNEARGIPFSLVPGCQQDIREVARIVKEYQTEKK